MDQGPLLKIMFEEKYPNIAHWIESCGWIELGQTSYSRSMFRVLDEGGMIWEGDKQYKSLDELLDDLEEKIVRKREELGV
jgi:hypothetical protein